VDPEDDLLGRDPVAVLERLDPRLGRVALGENVADEVLRLVDAAQDRSWRAKTSMVTTGSMPSRARIDSARAK
jgi:hypothetical protein